MDSTKEIYLSALYITNEESRNTPLQQAFGQNQVVSGGAWKSRLALYLGMWKAETSRRLLQRLVAEGTVREQAEICLRWISDAPGR